MCWWDVKPYSINQSLFTEAPGRHRIFAVSNALLYVGHWQAFRHASPTRDRLSAAAAAARRLKRIKLMRMWIRTDRRNSVNSVQYRACLIGLRDSGSSAMIVRTSAARLTKK